MIDRKDIHHSAMLTPRATKAQVEAAKKVVKSMTNTPPKKKVTKINVVY